MTGLDKATGEVLPVFGDCCQVGTGDVVRILGFVGRYVQDVVRGIAAVVQDVVKDGVSKAVMFRAVVEFSRGHLDEDEGKQCIVEEGIDDRRRILH